MSPVAVRKWPLLARLAASAIRVAGCLGLAGLVLFAAPVMGADYTFDLPDPELRELKASSPYFNRRFGRVTVESRVAADFLDEFRGALRDTFFASDAFDGDGEGRLSVRVVINELTKSGDVFPISYRADFTYELYDKDEKVGAWQIASYGTSTNFTGSTRAGHALTLVVQRNIRGFFLNLKASFDTKEAAEAKIALDRLQGEYKSDSINASALAGYLMMGGVSVVKAAGAAADATLKVMASPEFASAMSQVATEQARMNAQVLAVTNPTRQSSRVDAGRAAPSQSKAGVSEVATSHGTTPTDSRRASKPTAVSAPGTHDASGAARSTAPVVNSANLSSKREIPRSPDTRSDSTAADEAKKKREEEKVAREAADKAKKAAEEEAKGDYLAKLKAGTRLVAGKCPDGEGKYYVSGRLPKIKPELVSCVDVHFRALCPGEAVGVSGVGKNFLGASTDCFMGDTVTLNPTPRCKVNEVRVEVLDVRRCGG